MKTRLLTRWLIWTRVWYYTRYWTRLLFGLPALAVFILVLVTAIALFQNRPDFQRRYLRLGLQAMEQQNYKAANCYFLRLVKENGNRADYQYHLAMSFRGLGDAATAELLMDHLAPVEGAPGYLPAYLALADEQLASRPLTTKAIQKAESYIRKALEIDPKNVDAHARLGELYFRLNRYDESRDHLIQAVNSREALTLLLSRIQRTSSGTTTDQQQWADRAVAFYQTKTQADPKDSLDRVRWAEAMLLQGKSRAALEILKDGWEADASPAYRGPLVQAYVNVLVEADNKNDMLLVQRVALLDAGLALDALHPYFLRSLYDLIRPTEKNEAAVLAARNQLSSEKLVSAARTYGLASRRFDRVEARKPILGWAGPSSEIRAWHLPRTI